MTLQTFVEEDSIKKIEKVYKMIACVDDADYFCIPFNAPVSVSANMYFAVVIEKCDESLPECNTSQSYVNVTGDIEFINYIYDFLDNSETISA